MQRLHRPPCSLLPRLAAAALFFFVVSVPLAATQWAPAGPEGGAITALVADQAHPGVVYASGGAVFRSGDGGSTWQHAGRSATGSYRLAISGDVLYAAGNGVARSVDGGVSWQPTAPLGTPSWATGVNVLVADPRQPGRLWAGGDWSLWLTVDGGAHWTQKTRGIPPLGYIQANAFALDPSDGQLWVATRFGVFTSQNDGKRWTQASTGIKGGAMGTLAVDPAAKDVVLAGNFSGIWRRQGNAAWTKQLAGITRTIIFRGNRAFAAVDDTLAISTRIFHSDDHGKTWVPAQQGLDRLVVALAGSSGGVFAGSLTHDGRGGVYRSLDSGVTWQAARTGLADLHTNVVTSGPLVATCSTPPAADSTRSARSWRAAATTG